MNSIFILNNPIRYYSWGSQTTIAEIQGRTHPVSQPEAELWMSAHPLSPSTILENGKEVPLNEWIAADPRNRLGIRHAKKYDGQLPFLFKILAVEKPLSIQAHPNAEQAQEGFIAENALGVPLEAPHRNFKDPFSKPEMVCALSPFTLLAGFKKESVIAAAFKSILGTHNRKWLTKLNLAPVTLKDFFTSLMHLTDTEKKELLEIVLVTAVKRSKEHALYHWIRKLNQEHPDDLGILAPLYLNLIILQPGEALFLESGSLHTYLDGTALELMGNSDNVLRGGLTQKHIDIPRLISILRFRPQKPKILLPKARNTSEHYYPAPVRLFELSGLNIREGFPYTSRPLESLEILFCRKGFCRIHSQNASSIISLHQGQAAVVPAALKSYRLEGSALIHRASIPG